MVVFHCVRGGPGRSRGVPGGSGARLGGTTSAREHANKGIWRAAIGCRRHSSEDSCVKARKSARDEPAHFCVGGDVAGGRPLKYCSAARANGVLRQASREDSLRRSLCFCHAAKFDFLKKSSRSQEDEEEVHYRNWGVSWVILFCVEL